MPFKPYPYQAKLLADRSPRRIVLKARQTGLSNAIAIEALHLVINRRDSTVLFVSRNQAAARQLITYCQHTLAGLRDIPELVIENQGELAFANESRIISLPANPSTGRGFAATAVYLDEFARIETAGYDAMIYESVIGTVATGGRMTVLSTPMGRANMFFRLWEGLERGEWSRHRVHWSDCPTYTPEWGAAKKAEMPASSFAQDYDCDFLTSGEAVFDVDDLAAARTAHDLTDYGWENTVSAWDIGRRRDHTVGITISTSRRDPDVWRVRAYERFLAPYPEIQHRIEERQRRYGGVTWVESNGIGDPVIENLSIAVQPFVTTIRSKTQAIQALRLLLEKRRYTHDIDQLDRELSLYQWEDKDLVQDSVMAAAIGAHAVVETAGETRQYDRYGRPI